MDEDQRSDSADKIAEIVRKLSEERAEILDNFCKAVLANCSATREQLLANIDRMVLHHQLGDGRSLPNKWWVTFDGKMSYGDWREPTTIEEGRTVLVSYGGDVLYGEVYQDNGTAHLWDGEYYIPLDPDCWKWMPLPAPPRQSQVISPLEIVKMEVVPLGEGVINTRDKEKANE